VTVGSGIVVSGVSFVGAARKERPLTLSGSSTLTLRPGFALSGRTHSLLGLAKTLPELEDVSLLPELLGPARLAGDAAAADCEPPGGVDTDGRRATVEFADGRDFSWGAVDAEEDEEEDEAAGRGCMTARFG
jgi:hypothetical protein